MFQGISCGLFSLAFNPAEVGAEGKGYVWKASNLDDTDDEELPLCLWGRRADCVYQWKHSPAAADVIRTALFFSASGLVLKPDPESDSEDSEPDGPDDPVIPSPEMDDVKGEVF